MQLLNKIKKILKRSTLSGNVGLSQSTRSYWNWERRRDNSNLKVKHNEGTLQEQTLCR